MPESATRQPLKVLLVIGTRPEAIKMAPVALELAKNSGQLESRICLTAQHREMLDSVLQVFNISPDYDLGIMEPGQSPAQVASRVLLSLDRVLEAERPDWVLVQGDTTTAAAASVAAFYRRVSVGHVEAGLRTMNKQHPFPEEINRRLTSVVADRHFAPTSGAKANLLRENIPEESILVTGNTVIDALQYAATLPYDVSQFGPLAAIPETRRIVLVTAHRRENFGSRLESICDALRVLGTSYDGEVQIVYPVHPNPEVRTLVRSRLCGQPNITLTEPLDYLSFVHLLKRSTVVLTDSGGIQEEAPGLGKPVLVMRDVTERPEGIAAGTAALVGTETKAIVARVRQLLDDPDAYANMARAANPYGDGTASRRIVESLLQ